MMTGEGCNKAKLCPFSLGIALGVAKGICLISFAYAGYFFGYGLDKVSLLASFFHGYDVTIVGGLIGFAWGLAYGFVFGMVIGFVYNFCIGRCR